MKTLQMNQRKKRIQVKILFNNLVLTKNKTLLSEDEKRQTLELSEANKEDRIFELSNLFREKEFQKLDIFKKDWMEKIDKGEGKTKEFNKIKKDEDKNKEKMHKKKISFAADTNNLNFGKKNTQEEIAPETRKRNISVKSANKKTSEAMRKIPDLLKKPTKEKDPNSIIPDGMI